jgi:hypothetical protein
LIAARRWIRKLVLLSRPATNCPAGRRATKGLVLDTDGITGVLLVSNEGSGTRLLGRPRLGAEPLD